MLQAHIAGNSIRTSLRGRCGSYLPDGLELFAGSPKQCFVDRRNRFDVLLDQNHIINGLLPELDRRLRWNGGDLLL